MTSATAFSDRVLFPLDRARTALFVRATRVTLLRSVLLHKRRRVPALLLAHAAVALVIAVLAPTFLLVVGPLLLGVPHLLADLRYLVLRPTLTRPLRGLLLLGCSSLFSLRLLELLGVPGLLRWELLVASLLTLGVVGLGAPQLRSLKVLGALLGTLALASAALLWPKSARLVLGHGHNVVALAMWAFMFCRSRRRALGVVALLLAIAAGLLATPLAWWGFRHGMQATLGLHAFAAADSLAPGVQNVTLALGLVASFAFLQSIHYAVWLHAIPQETTRGDATLTFRMSFNTLVSELGRPVLALAALLVIALPLAGCFAPLRTQATYLSLSAFHAYLELAACALFWVRGESAGRSQRSGFRERACS